MILYKIRTAPRRNYQISEWSSVFDYLLLGESSLVEQKYMLDQVPY
jgi:hypothetical protein